MLHITHVQKLTDWLRIFDKCVYFIAVIHIRRVYSRRHVWNIYVGAWINKTTCMQVGCILVRSRKCQDLNCIKSLQEATVNLSSTSDMLDVDGVGDGCWFFKNGKLLFISYKFVKGFLAITFLLLAISSWNFHDVCQRLLYNNEQNFSWIRQKMRNFPIDPCYKNRPLL